MDSSRRIEERAAAWLAQRDSGHWTVQNERELQQWLDESTANTVAFIRLETVWAEAGRLKALGAGVPRGVVPPPHAWQLSAFFEPTGNAASCDSASVVTPAEHRSEATAQVGNTRSRRVGPRPALIAAAATILLVVGVGAYLALVPGGDRYVTPVGGLASVPISDGSKVTLNTDSEIRVAMTHTERRVDLDQGEAFFEVAHDPTRPFIVHAGNKRVIAVGTKFAVRRQGDDVRIVVTEGKVKLEADALAASPRGSAVPTDPATGDPGSSSGSTRNAESATLLTAGTIARARDAGVLIQQRPLPEVEDYLSWRSGFLTFRETSLGDAVAEFNRYNERQIVIDDPQIAAIRLSGKFRSTQFEAFVRLIEDGLPIRARYTDGRIVLTDARAAQ